MATATFYHDTRRIGKNSDKEAPLKMAISHRSSTMYIPMSIKIAPQQWNATEQKIVNHPQMDRFNAIIRHRIAAARLLLQEFTIYGLLETVTTAELKASIVMVFNDTMLGVLKSIKTAGDHDIYTEQRSKTMRRRSSSENALFANWFVKFMNYHQPRTRNIYQATFNRLHSWLGNDLFQLSFDDISKEWCREFDEYLKPSAPSPNSRGIHFRNIRAVINDAIDNELTTRNGMRGFKIPKAATRKRNLSVEQLRKLIYAQDLEPWMIKYRDFFTLSFMLLGMNCKDMCELTELNNDRVEFNRSKTGKPFSIKVHAEARHLIEKYRGCDGLLLNFAESKKGYRIFYQRMSKALPRIKDTLNHRNDGIVIDQLTSYWARHTWATIAASIDIPRDTIKAALGHGQHDVTSIYIEFDMRKVDEANRRVLDYVLYDKLE